MRRILLIAVAILVVANALVRGGEAQAEQPNNQWCAYFTGGPTNCDFATFDDCLQVIKGKTGLCVQNAQYVPPAGSDSAADNRRRHHAAQR
jgi:hypothetical protein